MFNACIIGVSGHGRVHYGYLMDQIEAGEMRALGATVINQEEEQEKCARLREAGCELFTDYREMLARFQGQIDLCFIPTGIALHAPMSIDAMRAGANVLVEKPVTATVQDVQAMKAAEGETGKFAAVGYQTMYALETLPMKRALCNNRIGKVQTIKYWGLWPRADSYYARNDWAGRLRVGENWVLDSPLNNALAHQLNMICFLAGEEVERAARLRSVQAELYRGHKIESFDTACLRAETHDGPTLYAFVTHCSERTAGPEIVVKGEHGELRWIHGQAYMEFATGTMENIPSDGQGAIRERMVLKVMDRMRDPHSFICGLDIAGTQTLAINGAHESSAIHDIDPKLVFRRPDFEKDSTRTVIRGIDKLIQQACDEERLFSEMGVGWAQPGEVFSVDGYSAFCGGRTGLNADQPACNVD